MISPTEIAGYLALFVLSGFLFLFINLLVGKFLRPDAPNAEKTEVYECGEPAIGSSFVQFDLRFYVVALLFIIFDVEVAFFFPWAAVFGKSTHLMDPNLAKVEASGELTPAAVGLYKELGVAEPALPAAAAGLDAADASALIEAEAGKLALLSIADIAVFFGVLLVGFAYVWRRGDLDWVRAVRHDRSAAIGPSTAAFEEEPALSA